MRKTIASLFAAFVVLVPGIAQAQASGPPYDSKVVYGYARPYQSIGSASHSENADNATGALSVAAQAANTDVPIGVTLTGPVYSPHFMSDASATAQFPKTFPVSQGRHQATVNLANPTGTASARVVGSTPAADRGVGNLSLRHDANAYAYLRLGLYYSPCSTTQSCGATKYEEEMLSLSSCYSRESGSGSCLGPETAPYLREFIQANGAGKVTITVTLFAWTESQGSGSGSISASVGIPSMDVVPVT